MIWNVHAWDYVIFFQPKDVTTKMSKIIVYIDGQFFLFLNVGAKFKKPNSISCGQSINNNMKNQ